MNQFAACRLAPIPLAFAASLALTMAPQAEPTRADTIHCDPIISFDPLPPFAPADSVTKGAAIEAPSNQSLDMNLRILNPGCAPLNWKVHDLVPGTEVDCPWITVSLDSGVVAPAIGSQPGSEQVTLRAAPLPVGSQTVELRFTSNDPMRPLVRELLTIVAVATTRTQRQTFGRLKARYR